MARTINPTSHALQSIRQETDRLNQRISKVTNQKSPTVPTYDLPTNPPTVSVEGELAVDLNGKMWWYQDGSWHTCGGGAGGTFGEPPPSRPANDNFASAMSVSGPSGTTGPLPITYATTETGEPQGSVVVELHKTLWFTWVAPSTGTVTFDLSGSYDVGYVGPMDTTMTVWTGSSLGTLTEIASNDDGPVDYTSQCVFTASGGTTYRIQVGTYGWSEDGTIILNWTY